MGELNDHSLQLQTRGVIFDLDGTLVDNMHLHAEAFNVFTSRHGLPPLDDAMRHRIDGKRNRDIFPILFADPLDPETVKRHTDEKEGLYRELSQGKLSALEGLGEFLQLLKDRQVPFSIATSAPEPNVHHSLNAIGLGDGFDIVVRGDQVPRGKPHPDVFLEAANQMNVEAAGCLVFEDAPAGIEAALAAGMRCGALTTSFTAADIKSSVTPHYFLSDYTEVLNSPGQYGLV